MRASLALCAVAAALPGGTGHGMLIHPTPRNARDRTLSAFANGSFDAKTTDGCDCANPAGGCEAHSARGTRGNGVGQACMWFSQGCSIHCPTCTGKNGHSSVSLCNSTVPPTNNNPLTRTMNRDSVAGSVNDTYRWNPWRAPGFAPVTDACGMAGGSPRAGDGAALFESVPYAKQGDLGSRVLRKGPPTATYKAGSTVEMAWGIRYNHGGGYQYRLAPADGPLTEAAFQKLPLKFAAGAKLRHNDGTETPYSPTYVTEGTSPQGSTWAMNPIPRITPEQITPGASGMPKWLSDACAASGAANQGRKGEPWKGNLSMLWACRSFEPVCAESKTQPWYKLPDPVTPVGKKSPVRASDVEGRCSGDWTGGQIVDQIVIPGGLPAGDYVLGFRWDCEETTQVWSSCADVAITA